jgi:hypothetical protein
MEYLLDVSELEPCEPRVRHRREPRLLFPLLEQRGFRWEMRSLSDHLFEIRIWRGDSPERIDAGPGL